MELAFRGSQVPLVDRQTTALLTLVRRIALGAASPALANQPVLVYLGASNGMASKLAAACPVSSCPCCSLAPVSVLELQARLTFSSRTTYQSPY